jgi:hypothetical protein
MYECGVFYREKKDKEKGKEVPLSLFQLWVGGCLGMKPIKTTAKKSGPVPVCIFPLWCNKLKTNCSLRFFDSIYVKYMG